MIVPTLLRIAAPSVALLFALPAAGEQAAPIKPRALEPGDTIMFVAPSGEVNAEKMERARGRLEEKGFRVRVPETITRRRGYLAGTDEERASELMAAFADPEVDAVVPVTGGYGTTRMLDRLDYAVIRENPKIFTGFSDITGLHLAIAARCNMITFHSPNPEYGLGSEEGLPEFHASYFWRYLLAEPNRHFEPVVYQPPKPELPIVRLHGGQARGRLTGGNLSLIAALVGTPYQVQAEGKILFLEDIREAPYRVDRMLSQLRLAGILDRPAAVILGAFHRCSADEDDPSLSLDEVFDDYFAEAPYPVLKRFPSGHGPWNAVLPLGAMAELDADAAVLRVVECPVTVD